MRWICSQCRRPVSLALTECPFCRAAAAELPPSGGGRSVLPQPPLTIPTGLQAPAAQIPAVPLPSQPAPAPSAHVVTAARDRQVIRKLPAAIESQPRPAPAESREGPLYRGFRLGLGFALAVVTVLLLLAVLLVWLRDTPWLDWLRR